MRTLINLFRDLALGLLLIGLAAAVLLYSDLGSRERQRAAAARSTPQTGIAIVQHASLQALDDGARGVVDALAARGYVDGARVAIRHFNAEGDMTTANTIAKDVVSGNFDLVVSISTASLQTIANANAVASPPKRHVFGVSSDPYGAGVGISRENHLEHPPYMTGIGSMPPVREAFELLKALHPDVARIGLVWNANEANSVAATELARAVAADLELELVETNAESSLVAGEAAAAVISRGIDALWISPDVTTITAADVLINAATAARVPAFTSVPGHAEKGALFDVGADYYSIGVTQGALVADVLDGTDPATVPVENVMPVTLHVNLLALDGLRADWRVPESVRQRAAVLIDADGRHEREIPALGDAGSAARNVAEGGSAGSAVRNAGGNTAGGAAGNVATDPAGRAGTANAAQSRRFNVQLIEYADTPNTDVSRQGVLDGLAQAGLLQDSEFEFRRHTAQGDIPTLSSIVDTVVTQQPDLIVTLSTPALQAAMQRGRGLPIVFSMVSDPFIVGAGKSKDDHLPHVTGAYLSQPASELIEAIRLAFPVESGLIAARVLHGESTASIPFWTSPRLSFIVNLQTAAEYGIDVPSELIDKASRVIR